MKNRLVSGTLFAILGALIAIGPHTIFAVCERTAEKTMKCYWMSLAEIGVGGLIAVIGLLLIAFRNKEIRIGLSLSLIPAGILAILMPTALIGACMNAQMNCRMAATPALIILGIVTTVVAAANIIYLFKTNKGGFASAKGKTADN